MYTNMTLKYSYFIHFVRVSIMIMQHFNLAPAAPLGSPLAPKSMDISIRFSDMKVLISFVDLDLH